MSRPIRPPDTHTPRLRPTPARLVLAALAVAVASPAPALAQTVDYSRAERFLTWNTQPLIAGANVSPNWTETGDTDRFWYRNNTGSGYEFVLVNPAAATRDLLFDHYRLASAMSRLRPARSCLDHARKTGLATSFCPKPPDALPGSSVAWA